MVVVHPFRFPSINDPLCSALSRWIFSLVIRPPFLLFPFSISPCPLLFHRFLIGLLSLGFESRFTLHGTRPGFFPWETSLIGFSFLDSDVLASTAGVPSVFPPGGRRAPRDYLLCCSMFLVSHGWIASPFTRRSPFSFFSFCLPASEMHSWGCLAILSRTLAPCIASLAFSLFEAAPRGSSMGSMLWLPVFSGNGLFLCPQYLF